MKSITIHGIDATLDKKLSEKSEEFGLSQNRTVKKIDRQAEKYKKCGLKLL